MIAKIQAVTQGITSVDITNASPLKSKVLNARPMETAQWDNTVAMVSANPANVKSEFPVQPITKTPIITSATIIVVIRIGEVFVHVIITQNVVLPIIVVVTVLQTIITFASPKRLSMKNVTAIMNAKQVLVTKTNASIHRQMMNSAIRMATAFQEIAAMLIIDHALINIRTIMSATRTATAFPITANHLPINAQTSNV